LELVEVGTDVDGDPITSCVIVPADDEETPKQDQPKLTKDQQTMFAILYDAGRTGLTTEEWNAKAREAGLGVKRKASLWDYQSALKHKGMVRENHGRWHINHSEKDD
jgi:hypothetical protein